MKSMIISTEFSGLLLKIKRIFVGSKIAVALILFAVLLSLAAAIVYDVTGMAAALHAQTITSCIGFFLLAFNL